MWRRVERKADDHRRIRKALESDARTRPGHLRRKTVERAAETRRYGTGACVQSWSRNGGHAVRAAVLVSAPPSVRLGLRENLAQFSLLVVVNAFVGAMVGIERTILPLLAEGEFHLAARFAAVSFIVVFGVTKALTNYAAGRLSDRIGRREVLIAGWIVAMPVPFLLMWAPTWTWILVANAFLGVSQGLTWSTTVIMKIDLVGSARRGFAMGLNEFAGYGALAGAALLTGWIAARQGLRPDPFYPGV